VNLFNDTVPVFEEAPFDCDTTIVVEGNIFVVPVTRETSLTINEDKVEAIVLVFGIILLGIALVSDRNDEEIPVLVPCDVSAREDTVFMNALDVTTVFLDDVISIVCLVAVA
jgi:hypothetical protein